MLARAVRETHAAEGDIEEIANQLLANIETLPDRIANAISDAMVKQHQLIVKDVRAVMYGLAIQPRSAPPPATQV
jgi:DNA-binding protein YbaB